MRVVVIGGAGYIGSHAARALRNHGREVVIYDNLSTGHLALSRGFAFVKAEVAEIFNLTNVVHTENSVLTDSIEFAMSNL